MDNEKRKAWEAKGRWGTKKEFLLRRKFVRAVSFAQDYDLAHAGADMINKLEGKDDVREPEEGNQNKTGGEVPQ